MPSSSSLIFLKKFLLFLFVLVVVPGLLWQVVTTSKTLHRYVLSQWVKEHFADTKVQSFDYSSLTLSASDHLTLEGVKLVLKKGEDKLDLSVEKLNLTSLTQFSQFDKTIEILLEGLDVSFHEILLKGGHARCLLYTSEGKMTKLEGPVSFSTLEYGPYHFDDLSALLAADQKQWQLNNLIGQAYDGSLKGQIFADYTSPWSYNVSMEFAGVNTRRLKFANENLFSQLEGNLDGNFKLEGDATEVKSMEEDLDMPQGGQIKAAWLSPVMDQIPASTQKEELEQIIKANGSVPVEVASLKMKSINPLQLTSLITVKSAKLNMDINLTLDINIEENVKKDLFKTLKYILPL